MVPWPWHRLLAIAMHKTTKKHQLLPLSLIFDWYLWKILIFNKILPWIIWTNWHPGTLVESRSYFFWIIICLLGILKFNKYRASCWMHCAVALLYSCTYQCYSTANYFLQSDEQTLRWKLQKKNSCAILRAPA